MRTCLVTIISLAAIGLSGAAFAEEATITTTGPAAMTDSEMDKVTAGTSLAVTPPCGNGCPTQRRENPDTPPQAPPLTQPPTGGVVEFGGGGPTY